MQFHRLFLSRYSTLYNEVKVGKKNHSLLHAKANKFSRNALIDSKPPRVTAHNTAFKSPFRIMSKFCHSGQRITFLQPQIRQVRFLGNRGTLHSSTDLKIRRDRDCSSKTKILRTGTEHLRWRAIWIKEMLGYQEDDVAAKEL